ncbi:MAG: LpxI family protein [Verrucomicrobiales bacterium]
MVDQALGLIAGNGIYPRLAAAAARKAGVKKIVAAAFTRETDPIIETLADHTAWMRVGQLGRMLKYFSDQGVTKAMMVGQIAPKNLFELQPDFRSLLVMAKLKRRNAETIFGAIADELAKQGVELLPAYQYLEDSLASPGLICGPRPKKAQLEDFQFGYEIGKEVSRLDIGQTVVVRHGTVVAVEAFEGSNEALKRGGRLARGQGILVKVSKPKQDMRFDIPVIGTQTIEAALDASVRWIGLEAGATLLLDKPAVVAASERAHICIYGVGPLTAAKKSRHD